MEVIGFVVDYLFLYQLMIEEGILFYSLYKVGKLIVFDLELGVEFFELIQQVIEVEGLLVYEVFNYVCLGVECWYNLVYWCYGDYVGVGFGVYGWLMVGVNWLVMVMEWYLEIWLEIVEFYGYGMIEYFGLIEEEQGDEFLLMGLCLVEGIDLKCYEQFVSCVIDFCCFGVFLEYGMVE